MRILGVIPARYDSTRFPGKVLAYLGDKPLIQWVYENAKKAGSLARIIIATDDKRIFQAAKKFKAEVWMTSSRHNSGTERVAEVSQKIKASIIVNIQGDEPFLKANMINCLVREFSKDKEAEMATLVNKIKNFDDLDDPNVVKVVFDKNGYALYFSRSRIPFTSPQSTVHSPQSYKHLGIYVYKRKALLDFVKLRPSSLEKIEKLEQLRALENRFKIKVIKVKEDTIGIDTSRDLERAERWLQR